MSSLASPVLHWEKAKEEARGVPTYVVVPSAGRDCLAGCMMSLLPQADRLFLVKNGPKYDVPLYDPKVVALDRHHGPMNISWWWNAGIDRAKLAAWPAAEWNVLLVNDDIVAPPNLVQSLSDAMRSSKAALACPQLPGRGEWIMGWCFMLRGEAGLRADEQFRWWHGDDDLHQQALQAGGSVRVDGCVPLHLYPGGHDEAMVQVTNADTVRFRFKWGEDA